MTKKTKSSCLYTAEQERQQFRFRKIPFVLLYHLLNFQTSSHMRRVITVINQVFVNTMRSRNKNNTIILYLSLSSLLLRPIFRAVCRTKVPSTLLDMTIPSIKGVAKFILDTGPCNLTRNNPLSRAWRNMICTSDGRRVFEPSRPVCVQCRRSAVYVKFNQIFKKCKIAFITTWRLLCGDKRSSFNVYF